MLIIFTILIPVVLGIIFPYLSLSKLLKKTYVVCTALLISVLVGLVAFKGVLIDIQVVKITSLFSIGFKADGLSKFFLIIIGTLWPLATLYATEYMEHEDNRERFFKYYLIAYGITVGIATSRNIITMYLFYELLTFLTLPLVMHKENEKSYYAGKIYLTLSVFGASAALIGIFIFSFVVGNIEFTYGGLINELAMSHDKLLYVAYLLCFIGFGVKAAIVPFSFWLPLCSVAPTPVSALLHAVAVVKAGIFAIIRTTYFIYSRTFLSGTIVEHIVLLFAIVTILYGSINAVRDKHIKRRLAYSTVSNLSYILFASLLMTDKGLMAGLTHMVFHAIIKINLFFAAGSIMIYANREYVDDVMGIAKKMPVTMCAFLIASLALIGVPLTCGFISKFALITSAISASTAYGYAGIVAIVISAILTVIYLFRIIIPAFFPDSAFNESRISDVREAGLPIKVTMIIITILIIYFGINSNSLINFIESIVKVA